MVLGTAPLALLITYQRSKAYGDRNLPVRDVNGQPSTGLN